MDDEIESLRQRVKELEAKYEEYMKERESRLTPVGYVREYAVRFMHENNKATTINPKPLTDDDIALYTSAPTIPEGWQLVPVIPTGDMLRAGMEAYSNSASIYKDMLAAAPNYTYAPTKCVVESTTLPEGWVLMPKILSKEMEPYICNCDQRGGQYQLMQDNYTELLNIAAASSQENKHD